MNQTKWWVKGILIVLLNELGVFLAIALVILLITTFIVIVIAPPEANKTNPRLGYLPTGTVIVKEIDDRHAIVNIEGVEYLAQYNGQKYNLIKR